MSIETWLTQQSGTLYAVVDAAADDTVVARFYTLSKGEASPLFAGTPFGDQAAIGPWLLSHPSEEFIEQHPELSGFYITSDQPFDAVRRHWQSLIQAIREGEALWFRFAEPRVFLPVLAATTQEERDALLGPCTGLWIAGSEFRRSPDVLYTPAAQTPWFHIRPHHLAAIYDDERHAYILRRRLWQIMTRMMEQHPDPAGTILPVLRQANADGLVEDVRDGVVAGALTVQAGLPLDIIRQPLMLTDAEFAQVNHWMVQHRVLTGATH